MRRTQRGFTFIEAMMGMMVLLTAISFIAPAFSRDLVLGRLTWERRLAVKMIETQLDQACQLAKVSIGTPNDFDTLLVTSGPSAITDPPELANVGATWTRTVAYVDPTTLAVVAPGPTDLKRVRITVNWTSQGRAITEPSADYLISRIGLCGTGA